MQVDPFRQALGDIQAIQNKHHRCEKVPIEETFRLIRATLTDTFSVELRGDEIWIGVIDNRNPDYVRERLSCAANAIWGRSILPYEYREAGSLSCLIVR